MNAQAVSTLGGTDAPDIRRIPAHREEEMNQKAKVRWEHLTPVGAKEPNLHSKRSRTGTGRTVDGLPKSFALGTVDGDFLPNHILVISGFIGHHFALQIINACAKWRELFLGESVGGRRGPFRGSLTCWLWHSMGPLPLTETAFFGTDEGSLIAWKDAPHFCAASKVRKCRFKVADGVLVDTIQSTSVGAVALAVINGNTVVHGLALLQERQLIPR